MLVLILRPMFVLPLSSINKVFSLVQSAVFSDESPTFTFLWIQKLSHFTNFLLQQTSCVLQSVGFYMKVQLLYFGGCVTVKFL